MQECETAKHGRLFSSVTRLMKLYISRRLAERAIPIKDVHLFTLLDILHYPGTSLKEACFRQATDKTTMTKAVKKLSELGYVDVKIDENDKRISRLYASAKANEVLLPCKDVMMEMRDIMYKGMDEEELDMLNSLITKMYTNLLEVV